MLKTHERARKWYERSDKAVRVIIRPSVSSIDCQHTRSGNITDNGVLSFPLLYVGSQCLIHWAVL